jgi:hypothetical protein
MRKIIKCGLMLLLAMCLATPAFAMEAANLSSTGIITPQFTNMSLLSAGLSISSAGKATCTADVTPSSNSYSSTLTVALQSYSNGYWTSIKYWTGSGSGFGGAVVQGYYYVNSGTYRVCSTANIYSSTGTLLETESMYSATKTY